MNDIVEKIRRSRESNIDVNGFTFTIRRLTEMDVAELAIAGNVDLDTGVFNRKPILKKFVVGWSGFKEGDLFPGGTGALVDFDSSIFMEWVMDKRDFWEPLTIAIIQGYFDAREKQLDAKKKHKNG